MKGLFLYLVMFICMSVTCRDIDYSVAHEMWKDVYNFTQNFDAPGVEVHCLHGYNVNTVER